MRIRIATRGSKLALWQANYLAAWIRKNVAGADPEVLPIVTGGDRIQDRPLHEVEGKTLFIKEVENALLSGQADVAVHCVKDYHPQTPPEFMIAAFPQSASDRDLLISRDRLGALDDLPRGARIGTTSQRRKFFLRKARPDLEFAMLRGNIDTRLGRLVAGEFDAIILAQAGIDRLGIELDHALTLPDEVMLPAVGQGALVIEVLADRPDMAAAFAPLDHAHTRHRIEAERAFVSGLSADCKSAVGVTCTMLPEGTLRLRGHVGHPETLEDISAEISGPADQAAALGGTLARRFLDQGAARLLEV